MLRFSKSLTVSTTFGQSKNSFFYADNPTVVPKVLKKDQEGQPPCQLRMSSIGNLHHGGNAGLRKIGPFNCNPIVVFAAKTVHPFNPFLIC